MARRGDSAHPAHVGADRPRQHSRGQGAVFPLIRTQEETRLASALDGKVEWLGAWGQSLFVEQIPGATPGPPVKSNAHSPYEIPPMPEGQPAIKPLDEDAAHFLVRQVCAHPIRSPSMRQAR